MLPSNVLTFDRAEHLWIDKKNERKDFQDLTVLREKNFKLQSYQVQNNELITLRLFQNFS